MKLAENLQLDQGASFPQFLRVIEKIGRRILNRLADELGEVALIEVSPRQEGMTMVQILAPKKEAAPKPAKPKKAKAPAAAGAVAVGADKSGNE